VYSAQHFPATVLEISIENWVVKMLQTIGTIVVKDNITIVVIGRSGRSLNAERPLFSALQPATPVHDQKITFIQTLL